MKKETVTLRPTNEILAQDNHLNGVPLWQVAQKLNIQPSSILIQFGEDCGRLTVHSLMNEASVAELERMFQ